MSSALHLGMTDVIKVMFPNATCVYKAMNSSPSIEFTFSLSSKVVRTVHCIHNAVSSCSDLLCGTESMYWWGGHQIYEVSGAVLDFSSISHFI